MQGGGSGSGLSGKADGGIRRDDFKGLPRFFPNKKLNYYFFWMFLTACGRFGTTFSRGDHPFRHGFRRATFPKGTAFAVEGKFMV